jgi:tetratricopeptide (TPR) repeat protein
VVVWLDDVHWAREALGFVEYALDADVPVLFVLTARPDEAAGDALASSQLAGLVGRDDVTEVAVERLADEACRELVSQVLPLEPELCERVVDRAAGLPLFAVHLLGDWVQKECLVATPQGFCLGEREVQIPASLTELWVSRIDEVLRAASADNAHDNRVALELAAALGPRVSPAEWDVVCRKAGVTPTPTLVDALVRSGLARAEEFGWAFTHDMLRQSLEAQAAEAGRLSVHHQRCAEAVEALYDDRVTQYRRARHLLAAGKLREALSPLSEASLQAARAGLMDEAEHLANLHAKTSDQLGLAEVAPPRIQSELVRCQFRLASGQASEVQARLDKLVEVALEHGSLQQKVSSLTVLGLARRNAGRLDESAEALERAIELAAGLDSDIELATAHINLGTTYVYRGCHEKSMHHYRRALESYRRSGNGFGVADALGRLGYVLQDRGELDEAEALARESLDEARRAGTRWIEANALQHLAGIASRRGDWEKARAQYREAIDLWAWAYDREVTVAHLNLAICELQAGCFDEAERLFSELEVTYPDFGYVAQMAGVHLGLACCAAKRADTEAFDAALEAARDNIAQTGARLRDLGELADRAGALAADVGWAERAEAASLIAEEQWQALGDDD